MISEVEIFLQLAALERRFDNQIKPVIPLHLISETVLAAPAASVTFTNIPQHFRNLILINQARTDFAGELDYILIRFNADAGANYDYVYLQGIGNNTRISGGAVGATAIILAGCEGANSRASNFAPSLSYLAGYARADREKIANTCAHSFLGNRSGAADFYIQIWNGGWRNTNAITSITYLIWLGANFVTGSIFQLYGLA